MRLLALMYHRARAGPHGNSPEMLDRHFAFLAKRARCVRPGDRLRSDALNVCLTFDDAYFDFYAVVLPLLKKYDLSAVLAVPIAIVREHCDLPTADRLKAPSNVNDPQCNDGGFCTWPELREIADSHHVTIAGHGFTHVRLDREDVDLHSEITVSQTALSSRLGRSIDSFVFPYGRFSDEAVRKVRQSYRYLFRIGGADNAGWSTRMLYRVDADAMTAPEQLLSPPRRALYRTRYFWNRFRGR